MKLIDIGAFNGDSVLHFVAYPEIDRIVAYEPNPDYAQIWRSIETVYPQVTFVQAAVTNKNGRAEYTKRPKNRPLGSTLNKDKRDWGQGEILDVKTIDVAEVVIEPCWLKIDTEGGEYDILERLIKTNNIKHVKKLFLEWHSGKLKGDYQSRQNKIESELNQLGIEVRNW